ncbi:MAG: hypothetical protein IJ189_13210 [Clostridia bacterium]|nr:hypothetical protein [Clostridia bacterium]
MIGYIGMMFVSLRRTNQAGILSRSMRRMGTVLLSVLFIALLALITIFPIRLESADFWHLAAIVLCVVLRPVLTRYILERAMIQGKKTIRILLRIGGIQLLFLPILLAMLLLSPLKRGTVWALLGGFAVSGILESFPLERMRLHLTPFSKEDKQEIEALRSMHAFKMFQTVMLIITAALQVTQVMTYTYIAVTADALILCMVIALLCTYAVSFLSDALLRRGPASKSDPNFLMIAGLAVWMYGLILFTRAIDTPGSVNAYLSLALCTMGATACVRVLVRLEEDMRRVAAFGIGHAPSAAIDKAQQVRIEFEALLGQMTALLGLTLIIAFTANDFPGSWDAVFRAFSPLLTLPALALVAAAILFALLFPLTKEHMNKLKKYSELQQDGINNGPLHDQLEAVVVKRSLKHYGIKLIFLILRPLYYHRIKGRENVKLDEDIPCVFVCNHGEIYGPVVTNLYVPYSFRPWVTYEMMDRKVVADRTMNGTFQNVKGIRRKILNVLMEKIAAPVLVWVMKSVDSIPVYHDNPRKLMQTFRETTAAMEAGDNILLFPENADTTVNHRYAREGVSEFFTGFAMIGQLYHNKTGKCPLFIPLYANKHKRTLTFGVPTRYNADINANDEKERLCTYLRNEMLKIAGLEQEK